MTFELYWYTACYLSGNLSVKLWYITSKPVFLNHFLPLEISMLRSVINTPLSEMLPQFQEYVKYKTKSRLYDSCTQLANLWGPFVPLLVLLQLIMSWNVKHIQIWKPVMTDRVGFKHSVPISKHKQEIDLNVQIQNTLLCLVAKTN